MSCYIAPIVIILLFPQALCLNILGIISLPLKSHYMVFEPLFRELANRGHSVTVINNFPDRKPVNNLRYFDIGDSARSGNSTSKLEFYDTLTADYLHLYNYYRHLVLSPTNVNDDCENLLTNVNAKAHLAEGGSYDVIFVEQFASDCGLVYAAAMYDAPIIGLTSHVLMPRSYPRLGLPFDASSDAFYFSHAGTNPSFRYKLENEIMKIHYITIDAWLLYSKIYTVFNKHLPQYKFDVERVAEDRIKMMFVNQHFSLTGARLLPPQVLEIGGIHIESPKPLSAELDKFLQSAEHGAIYVSFGSNLQASTMSEWKLQQFLKAFEKIPQKVIWKWENATLPSGYDNVYTGKWLPQLDILCHPKVMAFISHGGMLSLSETTYCGKPLLAVPFFGDQFSNAAAAKEAGHGLWTHFQDITTDVLITAIKELTSVRMQKNAQRISRRFRDRPISAMDSAIYWTEYVARYRTAPPSLPTQKASWFNSQLLDVYVVIVVSVFVILIVCFYLIKLMIFLISLILGTTTKRKTKAD